MNIFKTLTNNLKITRLTPNSIMKEVKIEIPSLPDNIRVVESFVDNAKERFKFSDDMYGNIMVSVTEAVNNAIIHGNNSDKTKNVTIQLLFGDDKMTFIIEDQGPGFNYENLPDPTAPENIEKPGGRGIFLIRHLCDELTFNETGSKVEMVFNV